MDHPLDVPALLESPSAEDRDRGLLVACAAGVLASIAVLCLLDWRAGLAMYGVLILGFFLRIHRA
jgi:hypothetical protein